MDKAWTIKDARGARIELWHGGGPEQVLDQLEPAERKQFSATVWPNKLKLTDPVSRSVLFFFGAVTASLLLAVLVVSLTSWPSYVNSIVVGAAIATCSVMFMRFQMRRVRRDPKYVIAMLALVRCPACLYKLSGLATEPDGCIVCPECGGAWHAAASEVDPSTVR